MAPKARPSYWQTWYVTVDLPQPLGLPVSIALTRDYNSSYKRNLLVAAQIAQILDSRAGITKATLYSRFESLTRSKTMTVSDPVLMGQLKQLKVVGNHATTIKLCSVAAVADALQSLNMDAVATVLRPLAVANIDGPMQLNHASIPRANSATPGIPVLTPYAARPLLISQAPPPVAQSMPPPPPPPTAGTPSTATLPSAPACTIAPTPPPTPTPPSTHRTVTSTAAKDLFYPVHLPFPTQLTTFEAGCVPLTDRFGFLHAMCNGKNQYSQLSDNIPLKHELKSYEEWQRTPMQLDRLSAPLKENTMHDHIKVISKVMGFLACYKGLQPQQMSLRLFSNPQLLTDYISFVWERSSSTQSINNNIYKCQRVVQWLLAKDPEVNPGALQPISAPAAATPTTPTPTPISATAIVGPTHVEKKAHLNRVLDFLGNMTKNFRKAFPHGKQDAAEPDTPVPQLPSKEEVLQWQVCDYT